MTMGFCGSRYVQLLTEFELNSSYVRHMKGWGHSMFGVIKDVDLIPQVSFRLTTVFITDP